MKRIRLGCVILFVLIFFTGCNTFNISVATPVTNTILKGQWKVTKCTDFDGGIVEDDSMVGYTLAFDDKEAMIFNRVYEHISYKAKVVDSFDYIYSTLGFLPKQIGEKEDFTVITISSGNTFIKDVIITKDSFIVIDGEKIMYIEKVSDDAKIDEIMKEEAFSPDNFYNLNSGVLLGLKSEDSGVSKYRTLWITYNGETIQYKEIPYILLPRKDGFFKVDNEETLVEQDIYNRVNISYIKDESKNSSSDTEKLIDKNILSEDITFIGNDYMSIRTVSNMQGEIKETLGTFLIDLQATNKRVIVPISSLISENDLKVIKDNDKSLESDIGNLKSFTNYGITRNRGRWCFYTLIDDFYNKNEIQEELFNEFGNKKEIMTRVSKDIARHDDLYTSWQGIKNQVPSAIDAISSPNNNLTIIKTKGKLYVYKVNGNELDMETELVIDLKNKEEIIMAEWALGQYVDYWSEEVNMFVK